MTQHMMFKQVKGGSENVSNKNKFVKMGDEFDESFFVFPVSVATGE